MFHSSEIASLLREHCRESHTLSLDARQRMALLYSAPELHPQVLDLDNSAFIGQFLLEQPANEPTYRSRD